MATSLINTTPANTYVSLLKLGDNSALTSTLKVVSDGAGNDTLLFVSTTALAIGTSTAGVNRFRVRGAGTTASTNALLVENSACTALLTVKDGGADKQVVMNSAQIGSLEISSTTIGAGGGATISTSNPVFVGAVATATARLQVRGAGTTSGTTALRVEDSAGTARFTIADDGTATFANTLVANGQFNFVSPGSFRSAVDSGTASNNLRFVVTGATKSLLINADYSNTNEATAMLEVQSTTKGFLPPKMTTTQKNAITSPAAGLVVYDTTTNKLCCYNGSTWNDLF